MKHAILFGLTLLVSFGKILSQQPKNFHLSFYTTENGLPSNGIKGLQWDEQSNFLWIATEAGISRFNGLDFKNFSITNTPFITAERTLFVVRNNAGRIYAADENGNLCFVKNNNLIFYKSSNPLTRFTITVSDLLFNNERGYAGDKHIVLTYDQFIPSSDTSCFIIHANRLYKYSAGNTDVIPYADSSLRCKTGFKLGERKFVIDGRWKVRELMDDRLEDDDTRVLSEDGGNFDLADPNNQLFWVNGMKYPVIINKNKAWILRSSQNDISAVLICDEIPTDTQIGHVQYDEQNKILVLGTKSKGIIVLTRNRVEVKRNFTGSHEGNAYYSQVALPDNAVLTSAGHVIGKETSRHTSLPIQGRFNYLTTITNDSLLWYTQMNNTLGYTCLANYNLKSAKTTIYPKIRNVEVFVYALSNGQLLVSTDHGIGYFIGDSIQYLYRHPQVTAKTLVYKIEEAQAGVILLAACSGILKFDIDQKKLDTLLSTDGYCIRATWKFNDYIFFGSYGKGFFVWKNGVLRAMPLDKRKYLLYTHCFMPDEEGYCWISTNRGLFKARIDELINAYEQKSPTVYYHYFGKNDGMNMMEMNGGCNPCALRLKDKTLSFPTMDGLLWVNPDQAKPVLPAGEIYIDEINADSMNIDPEKLNGIILPAKTDDISIRLGFAAWCNKENIYVDYQLNDTINWRPVHTDADALIHLNNLAPGIYTLRFRKLNGFGINNYSYKTIQFSITTPWYKSWWFNVAVVLAIAGLVLLYVNLRTRQLKLNQLKLQNQVAEKTKELTEQNQILEKNNSIKTRLISIISHDLVTPLKFLTAVGKNLIEKRNLMPEKLQDETLAEIVNTSQELQMLSTNILNWIKYQNENRRLARESFNVFEAVEQITGILKSLARQKQLVIINRVSQDLFIYQYHEPLKILIYNLLTNAINFSERGEIIVDAEKRGETFRIWVKDNGVGMTQDQIQNLMADEVMITANVDKRKGHGLGYLIIKDLLKMMGGSLHIESEKGKGSTMSFHLPISHKNI